VIFVCITGTCVVYLDCPPMENCSVKCKYDYKLKNGCEVCECHDPCDYDVSTNVTYFSVSENKITYGANPFRAEKVCAML